MLSRVKELHYGPPTYPSSIFSQNANNQNQGRSDIRAPGSCWIEQVSKWCLDHNWSVLVTVAFNNAVAFNAELFF